MVTLLIFGPPVPSLLLSIFHVYCAIKLQLKLCCCPPHVCLNLFLRSAWALNLMFVGINDDTRELFWVCICRIFTSRFSLILENVASNVKWFKFDVWLLRMIWKWCIYFILCIMILYKQCISFQTKRVIDINEHEFAY